MTNSTCAFHGKKYNEHDCLVCCICFCDLTLDTCAINEKGQKVDVCEKCFKEERETVNKFGIRFTKYYWCKLCETSFEITDVYLSVEFDELYDRLRDTVEMHKCSKNISCCSYFVGLKQHSIPEEHSTFHFFGRTSS